MTQPRVYWLQAEQEPVAAQPRVYWLQAEQEPVAAQPRVYWLQINGQPAAAPAAPRVYWLQINGQPAAAPAAPRVYWLQIDGNPVSAAADPPVSVSGTATGADGTTAQITITPASTGGTPTGFHYQLETPTGSGTWVTVAGTVANPTGAGVTTFDATGLTPGMQVTPRVAALRTGFADSAYTVGAPYYLDLVVGGGGELESLAVISGTAVHGALVASGTLTGGAPSVLTGAATVQGIVFAGALQGLVPVAASVPTGYYRRNARNILSGQARSDGAEVMLAIGDRRRR